MNKVTLVGNIGVDPDIRYTKTGETVVSFTMATNKRWKDKTTGELKQTTEWHKLVAFNSVAERAKEELSRGVPIKVEGEIRSNRWEKNGYEHLRQEVVVHDFELAGRREEDHSPTYTTLSRKERNLKGVEGLRKIVEEEKQSQSDSHSSFSSTSDSPSHSTHRSNDDRATK